MTLTSGGVSAPTKGLPDYFAQECPVTEREAALRSALALKSGIWMLLVSGSLLDGKLALNLGSASNKLCDLHK